MSRENITPEKSSPDKEWGGVTDPSSHKQANYRYLVHAVRPRNEAYAASMAKLASEDDVNPEHGDPSVDLYEEPEKVDKRVGLLGSLVDHEHHGVWADSGLIIGAPEESIIYTAPHDAGSWTYSIEALKKTAEEHPSMTPEQLLKETHPQGHNEVAMNAADVALRGFFYTYRKGFLGRKIPVDKPAARQVKRHAKRLDLPVVRLPHPRLK